MEQQKNQVLLNSNHRQRNGIIKKQRLAIIAGSETTFSTQSAADSSHSNEPRGGRPCQERTMSEKLVAANTPLESFFDLVFVLAFTRVTDFVSNRLDPVGVVQGIAVLMALWWAWVCYSWLTDIVAAHGITKARIMIFAGAAAIVVAALALPDAFGQGGIVFASAYAVARLLHVGLFLMASEERSRTHRTIERLVPGLVGGPALLVIASLVGGPARAALWGAALAIDYLTPLIRNPAGLQIHPKHFAERYGLVIILALGESIASIGVSEERIAVGVVAAAILAIVLCAALWWSYFDYVKGSAQKRLEEAGHSDRALLALDAYSYIHLAMVGGIVFIALGVRQTIADVEHPLSVIRAGAICGGAAVYLLGIFAFRLRVTGTVLVARLVAAALACAATPIALAVPSILTVAIVSLVLVGLAVYETLRPDRFRLEVKRDEQ
jgi:low temperature requirement protein LtrA